VAGTLLLSRGWSPSCCLQASVFDVQYGSHDYFPFRDRETSAMEKAFLFCPMVPCAAFCNEAQYHTVHLCSCYRSYNGDFNNDRMHVRPTCAIALKQNPTNRLPVYACGTGSRCHEVFGRQCLQVPRLFNMKAARASFFKLLFGMLFCCSSRGCFSGEWRGDCMHGQGVFTARDGSKLRIG
jgi:hypothetical protein